MNMWKVRLFFKVMKNEIENKMLRMRIKRAWSQMGNNPEILDKVKRQSEV